MLKEKKLLKTTQITDNKHLNYFTLNYEVNGKPFTYYIASRRGLCDLAVNNPNKLKADAVRIIPYFYKNDEMYVVLIREFRYPINGYIYGVPAGLVDDGEKEETSAIREIQEEIGAKVIKIKRTSPPCYSSAGMTDECISCFEAEVELGANQNLGTGEDIEIIPCPLDTIPQFLKTKNFGLQSRLQLENFYNKIKLNTL